MADVIQATVQATLRAPQKVVSSVLGVFSEQDMESQLDESGQKKDEPQVITIRAIEVIAEIIGTFMLVFVGTCTVSSAVTAKAQDGLWQVAVVWGIGLALAIYATADLSGAHLNPAISFTFALMRPLDFPFWKMGLFWCSQFTGAFIAGLFTFAMWQPGIVLFEKANNITRGAPGSQNSAMVLCCFFPNPALAANVGNTTFGQAYAVEMMGTGFLCMLIWALNDPGNTVVDKKSTPWLLGACLAMLISIFAPITQGCFNPARDFGPRLVALFMGWGSAVFPGAKNEFLLYLTAPLVGAPIGGLIASKILRLGYKVKITSSII